jgi:hypothetical protein
MRLWHVSSSEIRTFEDSGDFEVPPYAILTHTWGEEEVTFEDIAGQHAETKIGYSKIRKCSELAVRECLDYVWIDTCCIDQRNSAELSEAINSMYQWYKSSAQCFAYLHDVQTKPGDPKFESEFAGCRWFTRGWTLQELLAPEDIRFFNREWVFIGSKRSLFEPIWTITGINKDILFSRNVASASVATRMSWASKRKTKRQEDQAYCLLGIFGVNMPPIYGEGMNKAFIRLQEEILKEINDHSLFAWDVPQRIARHSRLWGDSFGILAFAPECFSNSGGIVPTHSTVISTYHMTNSGLKIKLQLLPADEEGRYIAVLECCYKDSPGECIGISLARNAETKIYWRDRSPMQTISFQDAYESRYQTIHISKYWYRPASPHYCICWVQSASLRELGFEITRVFPPGSQWNSKVQVMRMPLRPGNFVHQAAFLFSNGVNGQSFLIGLIITNHQDFGTVKLMPGPKDATSEQYLFAQPLETLMRELGTNQGRQNVARFNLDQHQVIAEISVKSFVNSNIWVLTVEAKSLGPKL